MKIPFKIKLPYWMLSSLVHGELPKVLGIVKVLVDDLLLGE